MRKISNRTSGNLAFVVDWFGPEANRLHFEVRGFKPSRPEPKPCLASFSWEVSLEDF
jgi:hypothetical protein